MKTTTILRIIFCITPAVYPAATTLNGASEGHRSGLTVRIVMADGTRRTARLDGVGCSASICSRTAIEGKSGNEAPVKAWLDSLAAIREASSSEALFVMKNGTERRLSLLQDFRVLYLINESNAREKLDLARVKSIEFPAPRQD